MTIERPEPAARRKCFLILGMHRSGTSALSGALTNAGLQRPRREMPAQADNEKGFFEPAEIVAIHDRLLTRLGSHWADWRSLPTGWMSSPDFAGVMAELEEAVRVDFEGESDFLVKDPRICRFVELWIALAQRLNVELVVLHIYRHPGEVAASLLARNGLSERESHLLWLRHIVESEAATRHLPRIFVSFQNLVTDTSAELASSLKALGVSAAARDDGSVARAEAFVEPNLKRQNLEVEALSDGSGVAFQAYRMLERLRHSSQDEEAALKLDQIRAHIDFASCTCGPLLDRLVEKCRDRETDRNKLVALQDERDVLISSLKTVTQVADRAPTLEEDLRTALDQCRLDRERADTLDKDLQSAETVARRVPQLEADITALHAECSELRRAIKDEMASRVELAREHDRMNEAWSDRTQAMQNELGATRLEAAMRSTTLQEELAGARRSLMDAEKIARRVAEVEALLINERQQHEKTRLLTSHLLDVETERNNLATRLAAAEAVGELVHTLEEHLENTKRRNNALEAVLGNRWAMIRRVLSSRSKTK